MSISSRAKDGRIWTTWNYPFSYSLQLVPQWRVNRLRGDQTFLEIYESHKAFLSLNRVNLDQYGMSWEYSGRNAIQSEWKMEHAA